MFHDHRHAQVAIGMPKTFKLFCSRDHKKYLSVYFLLCSLSIQKHKHKDKKRTHKEEEKRKKSLSSSASSIAAPSSKKTIEEMRAERIARERKEKFRAQALLSPSTVSGIFLKLHILDHMLAFTVGPD